MTAEAKYDPSADLMHLPYVVETWVTSHDAQEDSMECVRRLAAHIAELTAENQLLYEGNLLLQRELKNLRVNVVPAHCNCGHGGDECSLCPGDASCPWNESRLDDDQETACHS